MLDTQTFPQRVLDLLTEELKTPIPIKTSRKQVKESKLQHRFKSIQEKQTAAVQMEKYLELLMDQDEVPEDELKHFKKLVYSTIQNKCETKSKWIKQAI
jgi:hypothetical protein